MGGAGRGFFGGLWGSLDRVFSGMLLLVHFVRCVCVCVVVIWGFVVKVLDMIRYFLWYGFM